MEILWNTEIINPQELIHISKGDKKIIYKYLLQFNELIPPRMESLVENLKTGNRKKVRQILHQMSPQLQFFGIKDIVQPIRRLEHEYETIPIQDLNELVDNMLIKLDLAITDVNSILKNNF